MTSLQDQIIHGNKCISTATGTSGSQEYFIWLLILRTVGSLRDDNFETWYHSLHFS